MVEIVEKVQGMLGPLLDGTDIFIVSIKVKPVNNLKVYLDADSGFSIEKSSAINRKLYGLIEAAGMFPNGDFSLEVSSPGVDEPLTQLRQYRKNVGRKVAVTDGEGKETTGVMKEVTDDHVVLEVKAAKARVTSLKEIPFSSIKKTVVQISFN